MDSRTFREMLVRALQLESATLWQNKLDVPHLDRPQVRPHDLPGDGRQAAVLILAYPCSDDCPSEGALALTKRSSRLSSHAGQISFPGGRQDPGETLRQTALRETYEEIGVDAEQVEVLGELRSVYIPPSDFTVYPFVAWSPRRPIFSLSADEVEQLIEAPIKRLLQPTTLVRDNVESRDRTGQRRIIKNVPIFRLGKHDIWGATALMLGELIGRLAKIEPTD